MRGLADIFDPTDVRARDAVTHWPETATAVAARRNGG